MALVVCPDCGREISENADICPNCGFPLQKFLKENNISNIQGVLICPKCAHMYNGWYCKYDLPQNLKCEYCNSILVQTNENSEEMFKLSCPKEKEQEFNKKCIELAERYGHGQFSKEDFENQKYKLNLKVTNWINEHENQSQQPNTPHCPTCNSTNIHKISVTSKALNAGLFGLLGNKRKKQFHCNNCGYEW